MPTRLALAFLVVGLAARADVLVTTLDAADPVRGISVVADDKTVTVQTAGGTSSQVPTAQVVQIAVVPPPTAPPLASHPFELELVDGSRLRGALLAPADQDAGEKVRLKSTVLVESGYIDIPIDAVLSVRRADDAKVPGASRLVRMPKQDAAYRLSGARIEGTLSAFTQSGIEMDRGELGTGEIAYKELAAVFVDNEKRALPDDLRVVARLSDGSAIVLDRSFRVAAGQLRGQTPCGVPILVATSRIAALSFLGGSFVHVSDLEPTEVKRDPFFPIPDDPAADATLDFLCPVRMDRSPDGNVITIDGQQYYKGIGVRPTTELTFPLGGRFKVFEALCGIDDEVLGPGYGRGAGTGSVVFVVKVDGRVAFASPPVEGGRAPARARVPIEGAKTLSLLVTLVPPEKAAKGASDTPELDNAVWARPLLIR
ncbi:MAG TPA: NPCBM/NEW2 domain-containing protein [Planctomycetota bacterium]|nr:NPCBM/NEW2 domain-containing protein [Planctomycetota bacterium]